ncbi:uncharacterized protein [Dendrobates tinctorius]|uniref:uncharacterized protein isoform X3 n=1 Tax=Dendrobates tinctorius TaxID=92724 RepID=UPI003CC96576
MHRDRDKIVERILHITLEILFRLTGEDYTVVKKTSSEDPVSEGRRSLSPIMGPPPHALMHEDINDQKILEFTYKMIELLTGEVPIRCQDVTIHFSMEEWEYLEGHEDLYKDVMMEVSQPLTSPVLSSKRTTPERCPRPLLPQDCKEENLNVLHDHEGEELTHINTNETFVRSDERCKEEITTYDYPALPSVFLPSYSSPAFSVPAVLLQSCLQCSCRPTPVLPSVFLPSYSSPVSRVPAVLLRSCLQCSCHPTPVLSPVFLLLSFLLVPVPCLPSFRSPGSSLALSFFTPVSVLLRSILSRPSRYRGTRTPGPAPNGPCIGVGFTWQLARGPSVPRSRGSTPGVSCSRSPTLTTISIRRTSRKGSLLTHVLCSLLLLTFRTDLLLYGESGFQSTLLSLFLSRASRPKSLGSAARLPSIYPSLRGSSSLQLPNQLTSNPNLFPILVMKTNSTHLPARFVFQPGSHQWVLCYTPSREPPKVLCYTTLWCGVQVLERGQESPPYLDGGTPHLRTRCSTSVATEPQGRHRHITASCILQ